MAALNLFNTNRYVKEEEKQGDIPKFSRVTSIAMKLIWPAVLECFLVSLVVMIDGIMVSGIGNAATAAVTVTKQPYFLIISFITALNIVITTMVSRRFGENDRAKANATMHFGIKISLFLSLSVSAVIIIFARPICVLMGSKSDSIDYATTYLSILSAGFVFNGLRLTVNACQRSVGHTKISMITNIVANVVNVIFNYLFINGNLGFPKMGIAGAAIATVIGNSVACIISFMAVMKSDDFLQFKIKSLFAKDKDTTKTFLHFFPAALLEQGFMRFGFILFGVIVNQLGTDAQYVHGVCNDMNSLIFTIADGFSIGTAALIGHRLGEKRRDLAIVYAKVCMTISVISAFIVCSLMIIFRKQAISLYNPETTYKANQAANIMLLAAIASIPQNIQWVLTGILRGAGDTKFTATTSLISIAIIRPLASFVLCYMTPLGLYGAWIGTIIDQVIRCIANLWRFRSRVWINIAV